MIFQVPTDFFTPQSPIEAQGDEHALWEQFPFEQFPGSFDAYNEKLKLLTYRDPAEPDVIKPWTAKMVVEWHYLLANPNQYLTTSSRFANLTFVAGPCHIGDNLYYDVIPSIFPGWQMGAPISHHLGVSTVLLLDIEKLSREPICPFVQAPRTNA